MNLLRRSKEVRRKPMHHGGPPAAAVVPDLSPRPTTSPSVQPTSLPEAPRCLMCDDTSHNLARCPRIPKVTSDTRFQACG